MDSIHRVLRALITATALFIISPGAPAHEGIEKGYLLDLSDASVSFTVRVLGQVRVSGQFEQVQGDLLFTDQCDAARIALRISSESVTTHSSIRDAFIRGPALLNSSHYPTITFVSKSIIGNGQSPEIITGELQMNGNAREVSFTITQEDSPASERMRAVRYRATAGISRAAFGIGSHLPWVADTISIDVVITVRPESLMLAGINPQEETLP